jgi:hypothetical protein
LSSAAAAPIPVLPELAEASLQARTSRSLPEPVVPVADPEPEQVVEQPVEQASQQAIQEQVEIVQPAIEVAQPTPELLPVVEAVQPVEQAQVSQRVVQEVPKPAPVATPKVGGPPPPPPMPAPNRIGNTSRPAQNSSTTSQAPKPAVSSGVGSLLEDIRKGREKFGVVLTL